MRDSLDTRTLDLLGPRPGGRKSAAQRQAEYGERMRQKGYKRQTYWLHEVSRKAGYEAARAGQKHRAPAGYEAFSWLVGYADFMTRDDEK